MAFQKWSCTDKAKIAEMRAILGSKLTDRPQFPEVVGDRRILRFLRGHNYDVEMASDMMSKFLAWRAENGIDEIRQNIVLGGLNRPVLFPKGEYITTKIKQIVLAPYVCDRSGSPLVVDQYSFSPSDVRANMTNAEYVTYLTYVLEYRSVVMDQLSEEREAAWLSDPAASCEGSLSDYQGEDASKGYGQVLSYVVIRDVGALGFEHVSYDSQEMISAVVNLASNNYPELMSKTFVINTPWVFHTLWWFVQGLLSARTIAKVQVLGTDFKTVLEQEFEEKNIPALIGGMWEDDPEYVFAFDMNYLNPNGDTIAPVSTSTSTSTSTSASASASTSTSTAAATDTAITSSSSWW